MELLLGLMDGIYLKAGVAGHLWLEDCPALRQTSLRHLELLENEQSGRF